MRNTFVLALFAVAMSCFAIELSIAQSRETAPRPTYRNDPLIAWAATWGDTRGTGVYTCEEWKRHAEELFKDADKNRDGFLNEAEFKAVQQADRILKNADLDRKSTRLNS